MVAGLLRAISEMEVGKRSISADELAKNITR